jgi:hypothetical protein
MKQGGTGVPSVLFQFQVIRAQGTLAFDARPMLHEACREDLDAVCPYRLLPCLDDTLTA